MNCPRCHSDNPALSRFCTNCGAPLAQGPAAPPQPAPLGMPSFATAGQTAGVNAMPSRIDVAGLIQRIVNITLRPKNEWPVIAAEPASMTGIVVGCVVPLAAVQAVLSVVHMAVLGVSVPFMGSVRMPLVSSLSAALVGFIFALIGLFLFAVIVNAWAPFFGGRRSLPEALKVAAYAAVPGWLGSFCVVLPMLATLLGLLAGLYALYVLYLGLPVVMRAPKEKALSYTVAVILSGMLMGVALAAVSMAMGATAHFVLPSQRPDIGAQRGAAAAGNILGNVLGTDEQGKAALGQALGNLARAGEQMEQAKANSTPQTQTPASPPTRSAPVDGANANSNVNADSAANAGAALGSLMTAFGGALGGNHRVTPVDFRTLQELLPSSVAGMNRGVPEGENKEALGVKASSANATYTGPAGSQIQVTISDVSGVSGLIDIAGGLAKTTDSQTATGFERDTTVSGRSVHEKYTTSNRSGELQAIVGKRFEVEVDGHGVDMATLEHALSQVDLARLESMKNVGAQN